MSTTRVFKSDSVELVRNRRGDHFLIVLCGGVGVYECRVRLTQEEVSFIRDYGDYYVEKLAADIAHAPGGFKDRMVPAGVDLDQ